MKRSIISQKNFLLYMIFSIIISIFISFTLLNRLSNAFFWGRSAYVQILLLLLVTSLILYPISYWILRNNRLICVKILILTLFFWIPIIIFEFFWDNLPAPKILNNHVIIPNSAFSANYSGIKGIKNSGEPVLLKVSTDKNSILAVSNDIQSIEFTYFCESLSQDFYVEIDKKIYPLYCSDFGETQAVIFLPVTASYSWVNILAVLAEFFTIMIFINLGYSIVVKINQHNTILNKIVDFLVHRLVKEIPGNSHQPSQNENNLWLILFCVVVFGAMFLLNHNTPLLADDYVMSFNYVTGEKLNSLSNIFAFLFDLYYLWSGRIFIHFLIHWMTIIDKNIFDVINAFFYVYLLFLVYRLSNHNLSNFKAIPVLSFIIFLIWFFSPVFGSTILWRAGSPNYLWNTCFILTAMHLLTDEATGRRLISDSFFSITMMFILGFIAGMAQENTSGAMLLYMISIYLVFRILNYHWKYWMTALLGGAWTGFCLMVLAPGNLIRSNNFPELGFVSRLSMVLYRINLDFIPLFGLILLLTILVTYRWHLKRFDFSRIPLITILFVFCSLSACLVMILTNWYPQRASFGAVVFLIVGAAAIFSRTLEFYPRLIWVVPFSFIFLVAFIISFIIAYQDISVSNKAWTKRLEFIGLARQNHSSELTVDRIMSSSRFNPFSQVVDLSTESDGWPNYFIAKYYEISSIKGR